MVLYSKSGKDAGPCAPSLMSRSLYTSKASPIFFSGWTMGKRKCSTWYRYIAQDEVFCVSYIRMTLKHPTFYVEEMPRYVERCPSP